MPKSRKNTTDLGGLTTREARFTVYKSNDSVTSKKKHKRQGGVEVGSLRADSVTLGLQRLSAAPPGVLNNSTASRVQRSALILQDDFNDGDIGRSLWCGGQCMGLRSSGRRGDGGLPPRNSSIRMRDSSSSLGGHEDFDDKEDHQPVLLSALQTLRSALSNLAARGAPLRPQTIPVNGKPSQLRLHLRTRRPARSILRGAPKALSDGIVSTPPAAAVRDSSSAADSAAAAAAVAIGAPPVGPATPEATTPSRVRRLRFADEVAQQGPRGQPSPPPTTMQQPPPSMQQQQIGDKSVVGDGHCKAVEVAGGGAVGGGGSGGKPTGSNARGVKHGGEGGGGGGGGGGGEGSGQKLGSVGANLPSGVKGAEAAASPDHDVHADAGAAAAPAAAGAGGGAGTALSWHSPRVAVPPFVGSDPGARETRPEPWGSGDGARTAEVLQPGASPTLWSSLPMSQSLPPPATPRPDTGLARQTASLANSSAERVDLEGTSGSAGPPGPGGGGFTDCQPLEADGDKTAAAPGPMATKAASLLTRLRLMGSRHSAVAPSSKAAAPSGRTPGSHGCASGSVGGGSADRAPLLLPPAQPGGVAASPSPMVSAASAGGAAFAMAVTSRTQLQPNIASNKVMFNALFEPGRGAPGAETRETVTAAAASGSTGAGTLLVATAAGSDADGAAAVVQRTFSAEPLRSSIGAAKQSVLRRKVSGANAPSAWLEPGSGSEGTVKGSGSCSCSGGGGAGGADTTGRPGIIAKVFTGGGRGVGDVDEGRGGGPSDGLSMVQAFRRSRSVSGLRVSGSDNDDGDDGDGDGGECDAEALLRFFRQRGGGGGTEPPAAAAEAAATAASGPGAPRVGSHSPGVPAASFRSERSHVDLSSSTRHAVNAVQNTAEQLGGGQCADGASRRSQQIRAAPFAAAIGLLQQQPASRGSGSAGRGFPFRSTSCSSTRSGGSPPHHRRITAGSLSSSRLGTPACETATAAGNGAAGGAVDGIAGASSSPLPAIRFSPQRDHSQGGPTAGEQSKYIGLMVPETPSLRRAHRINGAAAAQEEEEEEEAAGVEPEVWKEPLLIDGCVERKAEGEDGGLEEDGRKTESLGGREGRSAGVAGGMAVGGGDGAAATVGLSAIPHGAKGGAALLSDTHGGSDGRLPTVPASASHRVGGRSSLDLPTRLAQALEARMEMTNSGSPPFSRRGRSALDMSGLLARAVAVRQAMTNSGVEPGLSRSRGRAAGAGCDDGDDDDQVSETPAEPFAAALSLLQHQGPGAQRPAPQLRTAPTAGSSLAGIPLGPDGSHSFIGAKAEGWISIPQAAAVATAVAAAIVSPLTARPSQLRFSAVGGPPASTWAAGAAADGDGTAAAAQGLARGLPIPRSLELGARCCGGGGSSRRASLVLLPGGVEPSDRWGIAVSSGIGGPGDSGDGSGVNLHGRGSSLAARGGAVLTAAGAASGGTVAPLQGRRKGIRRSVTVSVLVGRTNEQVDRFALVRQLDDRDRLEAVEALLS